MASSVLSAEYVRERAIRPADKPQVGSTLQGRCRAIADAGRGVAFVATLGCVIWQVWHLGVQFVQAAGAFESQMAATGLGGLF